MSSNLHDVKLAAEAEVLALYGLNKEAFDYRSAAKRVGRALFQSATPRPPGADFLGKAKNIGLGALDMARSTVFGNPINLAEELKKRYAASGSVGRTIGSHIKDFYTPHFSDHPEPLLRYGANALQAYSLAAPVYGLYNTVRHGDPKTRTADIASNLAGLATAPFTSQLGLPGALLQSGAQGAVKKLLAPTKMPPRQMGYPRSHAQAYLRDQNLDPNMERMWSGSST